MKPSERVQREKEVEGHLVATSDPEDHTSAQTEHSKPDGLSLKEIVGVRQ